MINVKPVDGRELEGWPIPEAGLPARAVHCLSAAGLTTVGALRGLSRRQVGEIRGLGAASAREVDRFLRMCGEAEAGRLSFESLRSLFDAFLSPREYETLDRRYGLHEARVATLNTIGKTRDVTREWVRQVQKKAVASLSSRLAQACLDPVYGLFEDWLRDLDGTAGVEALAGWKGDPVLKGYHRPGLLSLLSDCGGRIASSRGLYSVMPGGQIEAAEAGALRFLQGADEPKTVDEVIRGATGLPAADPKVLKRLMELLLARYPGMSLTADGRFFISAASARGLVRDILRQQAVPVSYRVIWNEYNHRVVHGSRKGAGYILEILSETGEFTREGSGVYGLRERGK